MQYESGWTPLYEREKNGKDLKIPLEFREK